MKKSNPDVEEFLKTAKKWQDEMKELRPLLQDSALTEEFKWSQPCYTYEGKNVVSLNAFKDHCILLFFKGALLNDKNGLLTQPTENTQSSRQMRFKSMKEVTERKSVVKAFVAEAIELEKSGAKVTLKKTSEYDVPEEFQIKLDKMPKLKKAFHALTPGRQRAYLLHFAGAKQSKTRESRIEKCIPQILEGIGFNEYK